MAAEVHAGALIWPLILLLFLSAFFSGSETALLTLNRYRVRHLARQGHLGARLAERLLARPDRLIAIILIGNNISNTLATSLVAIIAFELGGASAVAGASVALAFFIIVFTEAVPKTLGALRSERLGLPAAILYYFLLKISLPVVWLVSAIANAILAVFGVRPGDAAQQHLTLDELRTIVTDAGGLLPRRRQRMLMAILELEEMSVDEIMIPDNELVGIDLEADWATIANTIASTPHSRLPVYRGSVENLVGILPVRKLVRVTTAPLDQQALEALVDEPFFVPEGSSLHSLLAQFQRRGERTAFVIDEYGDIQGMATMEDILAEILGEFASGGPDIAAPVRREGAGDSWLVDAGVNIRTLNRMMNWRLPTDGPTTLNGLILEQLETIPRQGTSLDLNGYAVEVVETTSNAVRTVRVRTPGSVGLESRPA